MYLNEFDARNNASQAVVIQDKLMEGEYLIAQIAYKQNRLAEPANCSVPCSKNMRGYPRRPAPLPNGYGSCAAR